MTNWQGLTMADRESWVILPHRPTEEGQACHGLLYSSGGQAGIPGFPEANVVCKAKANPIQTGSPPTNGRKLAIASPRRQSVELKGKPTGAEAPS